MRLLIVDVNYDYKNSMYRLFYNNLSSVMEIEFFGPGYVSSHELELGIHKFMEKRKDFDAVIIGCMFIFSSNNQDNIGIRYGCYNIHRRVLPYYKINDAVKYCDNLMKEIIGLQHPIKIINNYEDFINMTMGEFCYYTKLLDRGFYMMSWGKEFMWKYDLKTMKKSTILTNFAFDLVSQYHKRYIPIPYHAIQANELFFGDLGNRSYDWCVPGNIKGNVYAKRNEMRKFLIDSDCKICSQDIYQQLSFSTIEKKSINYYQFRNKREKWISFAEGKSPYISSRLKLSSIAACREQYLESLRQSKCAYADGTIGRTLVRKYYEVCANGAVLVCADVPGLANMGFVDGENMIIADKNNILEISKHLTEDLAYYQRIAQNGRNLIIKKHSFYHRAINLKESIKTIQKGNFKGAHWNQGDYVIE